MFDGAKRSDGWLTGQTMRIALHSRRDRRLIVLAMEALTFWHEQERWSCVQSRAPEERARWCGWFSTSI
jgi:hypothetical protein